MSHVLTKPKIPSTPFQASLATEWQAHQSMTSEETPWRSLFEPIKLLSCWRAWVPEPSTTSVCSPPRTIQRVRQCPLLSDKVAAATFSIQYCLQTFSQPWEWSWLIVDWDKDTFNVKDKQFEKWDYKKKTYVRNTLFLLFKCGLTVNSSVMDLFQRYTFSAYCFSLHIVLHPLIKLTIWLLCI